MTDTDETRDVKHYVRDLYLLSDSLGMTLWEQDFIFSMNQLKSFSPKQTEVILKLVDKYEL